MLLCQLQHNTLPTVAYTQVLTCLHGALQAVDLNDPLLRVSVGLRLALHLEAADDNVSATSVLKEVSTCKGVALQQIMLTAAVSFYSCLMLHLAHFHSFGLRVHIFI